MIMVLTAFHAAAQISISAGGRDNRFIYGELTYRNHWHAKLEESLFAEKIGYQYLRGYAGYTGTWRMIDYGGSLYFGSTYNRYYNSFGARIDAKVHIGRICYVNATLNPHRDSGMGYHTSFLAGGGVKLTKDIDFVAAYTTIPEYRMWEKRIRGGFDIHVSKLSVRPELSVSGSGTDKEKSIRALIGFRYDF